MVNTRMLNPCTYPHVLPSECEKLFYSEAPGKVGWSYIVRYGLSGRHVKYIVLEKDDIEEEYEEDDAEKHIYALDEEFE